MSGGLLCALIVRDEEGGVEREEGEKKAELNLQQPIFWGYFFLGGEGGFVGWVGVGRGGGENCPLSLPVDVWMCVFDITDLEEVTPERSICVVHFLWVCLLGVSLAAEYGSVSGVVYLVGGFDFAKEISPFFFYSFFGTIQAKSTFKKKGCNSVGFTVFFRI